MKTLLTTVTLCSLFALVSTASAGESPQHVTDLLIERSNSAFNVAKGISDEYSPKFTLLTSAAEVQDLATKFRYLDPVDMPDVTELFDKLESMKLATTDLIELAEENDDELTVKRAKQIRRLIFKMRDLTERLEGALF